MADANDPKNSNPNPEEDEQPEVTPPAPEDSETPEPPEEVEEPEAPEGDEDEPEDEESEEKPLSRRQQLRMQQLFERIKGGEELPEVPSKPTSKSEGSFNYDDLEADPELVAQIKAEANRQRSEGYNQGLEQTKSIRFQTRLEIDAPRVEAKYPVLDPGSDDFNPVLAETINRMYLSTVGFDDRTGFVTTDKLRYAEYVEGLFELSDEMGRKKVESSRRNITSQAAKSGPRPGGSAPAKMNLDKAPEAMTDAELKAKLKSMGL